VHRQAADIPPGEKQRGNHEGIGSHHHAPGIHLEQGLVVGLVQQRVVEGLAKQ
jgi:hypothetical protein